MKKARNIILCTATAIGLLTVTASGETENQRVIPFKITPVVGDTMVRRDFDPTAIRCLADNIFFESRALDKLESQAITNVVINRVASSYFPDSICEVIYQPHQFSWTSGDMVVPDVEREHYQRAHEYATEFYMAYINGALEDITHFSILYRANYFFEYGVERAAYGQHHFGVPVGTFGY